MPSSKSLRHAFTPQKASQQFGVEGNMTLRIAKHVYKINPLLIKHLIVKNPTLFPFQTKGAVEFLTNTASLRDTTYFGEKNHSNQLLLKSFLGYCLTVSNTIILNFPKTSNIQNFKSICDS